MQVEPDRARGFDFGSFAERVTRCAADVSTTPHLVRFTADGIRFSVFRDGRAILFGLDDLLRARALYDRWIGA